ncbi:hypothetical protein BaRGS_00005754 [Batillaria attramentaria]|uniref:Uncharacterized protein n=1 Tax=Batillaria attramentaria TaxID=370345 RepID=A0ABD0LV83_9CAEN
MYEPLQVQLVSAHRPDKALTHFGPACASVLPCHERRRAVILECFALCFISCVCDVQRAITYATEDRLRKCLCRFFLSDEAIRASWATSQLLRTTNLTG